MRLLHTADWHLGKHLEGKSRLEEQRLFIDELVEIVQENQVDLVLVSGDIYDTFNPPAEAEKLFFQAVKRLSDGGERIVLIIAGNHDSPNRLMAAYPLAYNQGIIILGTPGTEVAPGKIGRSELLDSGQGFLELMIKGEKVVILTLPYPSESRLNKVLSESGDERDLQEGYSKQVGQLFAEFETKFREDTINLAISHLFVAGGETTKSERPIQVGGGLTVNSHDLPANAQYIALGHLHRGQTVSYLRNAFYAGSPLQYSLSEIGYSKSVFIVDLKPGEEAEITERKLKNTKPIEIWEVTGMEEAIEKLEENSDRPVWAYLKIKTDRTLLQSEIKKIKQIKPDIVSIIPVIDNEDEEWKPEKNLFAEKDMMDLFQSFYRKNRALEPADEVLKMFSQIVNDEDDVK